MDSFFPYFSQAAVVMFQGAWLSVAVYDNIRNPYLNERGFIATLNMNLVKEKDSVAYEVISTRRVSNPKIEKLLFHLLVVAEVIVAILLWFAASALFLAGLGITDPAAANFLAHFAVLGFLAIWSSLLIGGQWFWYRVGLLPALQVHFFLVLWSIGTLIYLSVGG